MIAKTVDECTVAVIAEDADDLLSLRRLIRAGDRITGETTRVIKRDREYSRPDRGERTRVRISLHVERISLDSVVDRLRVSGAILESNNDAVPHGSHHSMLLKTSESFAVYRRGGWDVTEKRLIRSGGGGSGTGFVLVAVDRSECGIGVLNGTRLRIMPNIYSGAGGKRYKTSFDPAGFFREISGALASAAGDGDGVVIFGPGETKKRLANHIAGDAGMRKKAGRVMVAEGIDSGGEDGIHIFTKSAVMREVMSDSKIARVAGIIDDVMRMAGRKSRRFTMGYADACTANDCGAIESLVFSDRVLEDQDEQKVVEFLNDAESKGASVFSVDSSTDLGLRVTGLGGIVATLRFAVEVAGGT